MVCGGSWKDKLKIEDLVSIDPDKEGERRNRFVELNSKFFEDFIYYQSDRPRPCVFVNLINRIAEVGPKWLKNQLKSNRGFWKCLTKNCLGQA